MYSFKSALKIISYILISIVLMLFLAFVLTYNFDSVPTSDVKDGSILKAQVIEKLDEAERNINALNEIEIKLGTELTNDLLIYLFNLYTSNSYSKEEYWEINKITFTIEDRLFCATVYTNFKDLITYSLKAKIYFDVTYSNNEFVFDFIKFKIGSIVVPDKIISSVLKNNQINSIGYLMEKAFNSISIINADIDNLRLTVEKDDLLTFFSNGSIGTNLFGESKFLSSSGYFYINSLFDNDMISLSVDDGIIVKIDCSKIRNGEIENKEIDYNELFNTIKTEKEIELEEAGLIFKYNTKDLVNDDTILLKFKDVSIDIEEKTIYLNIYYDFLSLCSKVTYTIELVNGMYKITNLTIGKDDNELVESCLTIDKSLGYSILNELNISVTNYNDYIEVKDLFYVEGLELMNYKIDNDMILLSYK